MQGWYYVLASVHVEYNIFMYTTYNDLSPRFKSPIPEVSPIDPLPEICIVMKTRKEIKALEKAHSGYLLTGNMVLMSFLWVL